MTSVSAGLPGSAMHAVLATRGGLAPTITAAGVMRTTPASSMSRSG